jgi:hypothetical protein
MASMWHRHWREQAKAAQAQRADICQCRRDPGNNDRSQVVILAIWHRGRCWATVRQAQARRMRRLRQSTIDFMQIRTPD